MSAKDPPLRKPVRQPASATQVPDGVAKIVRSLEFRMLVVAVLLALVLSILSPLFPTRVNVVNILNQSVVIGVVSVGMTFVVLTGGIDLSVGAVAGLSGIVFGLALQHLSIPLGILATVALGGAIGLLSGLLVNLFGLAAFVVTLGVMAIARSLAFILSGQQSVGDLPEALQAGVHADVLGLPLGAFCLIALYALAWGYLTFTKGGRTIYAVGSNREAARAAGLNTLAYSVLPYAVSGALAALAGTVSVAQLLAADPQMGGALELDAIAAAVIGGASLAGGRGSVIGTLIGVLIMVMIRSGLNLMGVSPFWQGAAIGTVIIVALLGERLVARRAGR